MESGMQMEQAMTNDMAVLCVGLVCLDIISICDCYPDEDTDIRAITQTWKRGGNASTSALVLSLLGSKSEFYGTVPNRANPVNQLTTDFVLGDLQENGVCIDNVVKCPCNELPTSIVIINKQSGSRTIVHHRGGLPELSISNFNVLDLNKYKWIHFEGRTKNIDEGKLFLEKINLFNKKLNNKHINVSIELEKPKQKMLTDLINMVDLVIMSKEYAVGLGYSSALEAACEVLKNCRKNSSVVVAWGEKGAAYATNSFAGDKSISGHCPAVKPLKIVDTLGAGDVFNAALIHALSSGKLLKTSVEFACKTASHKISSFGFKSIKNFA